MIQTKQRGLTLISWVIIIALAAIQGVAAMRIVPVYLDFYSAKKIMEELKESSSQGMTNAQLQAAISKSLAINNLYSLMDNKDAFSFQKTHDGVTIILHYEARGSIYGNLEFVATFDHEVNIPKT